MSSSHLELTVRRQGAILARRVLSPGEYVLGGRGSDVELAAPDVSDRHARLIVTPDEVFVEDLGSSCGTFVDGSRIASRIRLFPAQQVSFGAQLSLEVQRLPADPDEERSLAPREAALERLLSKDFWDGPRYREGKHVAQGGMGAILETYETPLRRTVAMKVMLDDDSEASLARFIAEARLTGQLEHPNIVPVHEFGIDGQGRPFYTMKYVRGVTLKDVLTRLQRHDPATLRAYPLDELLSVFQKVCDALAFAHSRFVVHRDLKPENIMLGDYGEVLVLDWGLAKICRSPEPGAEPGLDPLAGVDLSKTLDGSLVGTPHFMSPEQARGESVDFRTDIYALGAVLFAILHLRPPVSGKDVREVLEQVRRGHLDPVPLAAGAAHLPRGRVPISLTAVVSKAMALEPGHRYQQVVELQAEISAYRGGFATAAESASALKQFWLALGRHKREAAILAVSLLLLAGGTVFAFLNIAHERTRAESALRDLQGSVSAFVEQARSLAAQERFSEGIEKLDYALKIQPEVPAHLLAKADFLRSLSRFTEAAAAYREATRCGAREDRVVGDALLCDQLASAGRESGSVSKESLSVLFSLMQHEQRPPAELMPFARLLGRESEVACGYWAERLRDLPIGPGNPIGKRLSARADGLLSLNLSGTTIADLQPLAEMPLAELDLSGCTGLHTLDAIADLPLRTLKLDGSSVAELPRFSAHRLEYLSLQDTAVSDLHPVAGLPLKALDCSRTAVVEVAALAALPLQSLRLDGTHVNDLSVLKNLPLKVLSLGGCADARGFRVLQDFRALETLILPKNFCELPSPDLASIRALQTHPSLRQLATAGPEGMPPTSVPSREDFLREWAADFAWLERCWKAGLSPSLVKLPDSTWEFELHDPVRDLACLAGAPISKLNISSTLVTDLRPLAGMPLRYLDLRVTPVMDLSPLRGLPLRQLFLWRSDKVEDFSFLQTLTQLELLDVSETALTDLALLRSPHLRELRMGRCKVTDLSPLATLPLEKLHCDHTPIRDLRPLLQCVRLKWLIPPKENCDAGCLRMHPSLERISYEWLNDSLPTMTAAEFWKNYDASTKSLDK